MKPIETNALELEQENGWLRIWFNQPDTRNALSSELAGELLSVLEAVEASAEIRGISLRGRGGVFCAGGDLKAFKSAFQQGADDGARAGIINGSKAGAGLFDKINAMPQVVVAVIEGAAMAGGLGLACCADITVVEASAKFAFTETSIGLTPAQIAPFVIQKIGPATARRLMLTSARFDGIEAERFGLADIVAEGADQIEEAERVVRAQALRCAPGAVARLKRLLAELPRLDRSAQIEAAAENFADCLLSDEGREGVLSFVEKRKPAWAKGA